MATYSIRTFLYVTLSLFCLSCPSFGLTRWSTFHIIPDADFLPAWSGVAEYQGYYFNNDSEHTVFKNAGSARFGISEWVDLSASYVGGLTFGLKAKILGETSPLVPSLALGVHNFRNNQEDYYYNHPLDVWKNEFFVVLGKSVEAVRLRFDLGVQTMPDVPKEKADCFFGIEKYMGGNAYLTLETFYRDKRLRPSLFTTVRFFKEHAEFSVGAVDLATMFFDTNNRFAVSFASPPPKGLVRPGIWVSLRILISMKPTGTYRGFGSLEEEIDCQKRIVKILRNDVDSLKDAILDYSERIDSLSKSFRLIADSAFQASNAIKLKETATEKLEMLVSLYGQENIDATQIKKVEAGLCNYRNSIVPVLKEIALDNKCERKVRVQAVAILGAITTDKAVYAVLDILAQTQDPDVKIEGIFAIGKKRDFKGGTDLLKQYTHDPNDAVAFAANEVLQKQEKGYSEKDTDMVLRPAPMVPPAVVKQKAPDTLKKQSPTLPPVQQTPNIAAPEKTGQRFGKIIPPQPPKTPQQPTSPVVPSDSAKKP